VNKAELVAAIAEKSGLTKKDAEKALAAFTEAVTEAVKADDKVQIMGFGTFELRKREAHMGNNPRTGEKVQIEASNVPAFKAGKGFKDAVK